MATKEQRTPRILTGLTGWTGFENPLFILSSCPKPSPSSISICAFAPNSFLVAACRAVFLCGKNLFGVA
jgi:hypothetical protein